MISIQEDIQYEKVYNLDQRSEQTKSEQFEIIHNLSQKNKRLFNLNEKKHHEKIAEANISPLQEIQLDNGWFCTITDNKDKQQSFTYNNFAIFTIHGCPAYSGEWRYLEKSFDNKSRFINFYVPGFDGKSEMRGDYDGSVQDISRMIAMLLDKLEIPKIIITPHSMGGYIMSYFAQQYPHRIAAIAQVACPAIDLYLGNENSQMMFYNLTVVQNNLNQFNKNIKWLFNHNKFRQQIVQSVQENRKNGYLEGELYFPELSENEIFAYIKLMTSFEENSHFFTLLKNQPQVFKILSAGEQDVINPIDNFISTFHHFVYGDGKVQDNMPVNLRNKNINQEQFLNTLKQNLKNDKNFDLELFTNFNWNDIQSNFVFLFENTGHSVHRRRGDLIGKVMQSFAALINQVELMSAQYKAKI